MPDFTYEALGETGARTTGTLTAGSEREVVTMLDSRGLFPVRIDAAKQASATAWRGKKVSTASSQSRRCCSARRPARSL